VRNTIEEHDPAIEGAPLPASGESDVDHFVLTEPWVAGLRDGERSPAGVDRENAALRPGRIFETGEGDEENGAECEPPQVHPWPEAPSHLAIIRNVTRDEIEQKLIVIVRNEKDIAEDLLKSDTALADAGIDSLDSLTILFAIEEEFHISIPDDRARAMKTFGDMIGIVQELVPAE
jgi:acyl carrier protein